MTPAGDLVDFARHWSEQMAAAQRISHDPNIRNEIQNYDEFGDNVGTGPDVDHIHTAFMNSATHRHEILYPRYTQVGIGIAWNGQAMYVTEVFRIPLGAAAGAASHPVVAPAARPAPSRNVRATPAAASPTPTTAVTTAPASPVTQPAPAPVSVATTTPVTVPVTTPDVPLRVERVRAATVSREGLELAAAVAAALVFALMAAHGVARRRLAFAI